MIAGSNTKHQAVIVAVALAAVTIAAYWGVGGHGFVLSDDADYVFENPQVMGGLSWHGIRWALAEFHASNWHPVTWISHMVDVELFGMNAGRHHLVNLALHVFNTILIFGFLYYAAGRLWASALVAGLFALHPMHVESVAWVAERKDVLSTCFWLAAMWMYVLYVRKPGWGRYLAAIALFAMGLMSKPMLFTLPLALLLLDYWPLERFEVRRCGWRLRITGAAVGGLLTEKVPFFLMAAASLLVTLSAQRPSMQSVESIDLMTRLANAMVSYAWYAWKMVYPFGLSILYPYPDAPSYAWAALWLVLLLCVTAIVLAYGGKLRYLPVGWLWYLVTLVPVIGLVQVGIQSHADRYTYVPYLGLFIIVAWACSDLLRSRPALRGVGGCIAGIILLLCGILTWQQVRYWRDDVSLLGRSLRSTRNNYVLQTNLGIALASRGEVDDAMRNFRQSLETNPDYVPAIDAIGTLLAQKGEYEKALEWHMKAAIADPEAHGPQYNIAVTLMKLGRTAQAIPYCARAVRMKPQWPEAHMQLGIALAQTGEEAGAIAELSKATELNPRLWKAYVSLADVYVKQGMWDEAARQYRRSLELRTDYDCLNNLGSALVEAGRPDEAEVFYRQAIAARPDIAQAYCNLAVTVARKGRAAEAITLLEQAIAIEPGNAQARKYLEILTKDR